MKNSIEELRNTRTFLGKSFPGSQGEPQPPKPQKNPSRYQTQKIDFEQVSILENSAKDPQVLMMELISQKIDDALSKSKNMILEH